MRAEPTHSVQKRGRPRAFEDDAVFRISSRLLLDGGLGALTLQRVAKKLGYSHQAVAQRFASKEGLLRAYFDWLTALLGESLDTVRAQASSPLEGLLNLVVLPVDPRLTADDVAGKQETWILIILELRRDPALAETVSRNNRDYVRLLVDMVKEAQELQQLAPADPRRIAESMLAAVTGAAVLWTVTPDENILETMQRCRDAAIAPFLLPPDNR